METYETLPPLPARPAAGHKGTFGTVLVAAGSPGMAGAAGLCALAVLRSGAGLCRVACPAGIQPQVAAIAPCATTLPLELPGDRFSGEAVAPVLAAVRQAGTLALGPGLGQGAGQVEFIGRLLAAAAVPTVVDADGLNGLARLAWQEFVPGGPLVLTPHPGEAGRLLGTSAGEVQADRAGACREIARRWSCCCLLKGARTLVVEGERIYTNRSGDSGLATGGSGDVLTGVIAALLAQGVAPFAAAVLGAWLHGRAGELGSAALGPWSLTAADLLDHLPAAFKERALGRWSG